MSFRAAVVVSALLLGAAPQAVLAQIANPPASPPAEAVVVTPGQRAMAQFIHLCAMIVLAGGLAWPLLAGLCPKTIR